MTDIVLSNITSGYNISKINDNFQVIKENINNDVLHKIGGDNILYQDLDLNSNDLLNVGKVDADTILLNGSPVVPTNLGTFAPNSVGTPQIIDGSVTSTKIASGSIDDSKIVPGGLSSGSLSFTQAGTGATTRTMLSKERDFVNLSDFGAKGDGLEITSTVSISSGSNILSVSGASFVSTDIGKVIVVPSAGASGLPLFAIITGVTNPTTVSLDTAASNTLSSVSLKVGYGTDNYSAINAAITYCSQAGSPKTIRCSTGIFCVNGFFTITTPLRFIGEGSPRYPWLGSTFPQTYGTTIKYVGPQGAVFFKYQDINMGGAGMFDIFLDGSGLANFVLNLQSVTGWKSRGISIRGFQNVGLGLTVDTGTCSWNDFTNTYIEDLTPGKCCLWLAGNTAANACHNTFTNTTINHRDKHAIYLGGCDNIAFTMVYIFRDPGGIGKGVYCDFTEQVGFPISNVFTHLQAGAGGWFEPAAGRGLTSNPTALIWGYMMDNGQPYPVTNGARLPLIDSYGRLSGLYSVSQTNPSANWYFQINAPSGSTSTNITFPNGPMTNANYSVILNAPTTVAYAIQNKTAAGFTIVWASALPASYTLDVTIIGG